MMNNIFFSDNMSDEFSVNEFLESIKTFHETRNEDEYGRYRSWEYCNNVFNDKHDELIEKREKGFDLSDDDYDYLALHLSFYLASWGMYRGSSMLLSTNYKIHIPIVKELMKKEYDNLWNITYDRLDDEKNKIILLTENIKKAYAGNPNRSYKIYQKEKGNNGEKNITPTLLTKILLGTLACVPAYDTYFKDAINKYKSGAKNLNTNSIEVLAKFYDENKNFLNNLIEEFEKDGVRYPQMKILDMGFFEYGKKLKLDVDDYGIREKKY